MSFKTINLVLIISGVSLFLLSIFADVIGVGSYPGINWAQILGAAVGIALLITGIIRSRLKIKE